MARLQFSQAIELYAEKVGATLDETLRAVALDLYGSIIKETPVETGRAKGNWQTTLGSPAVGAIERTGEDGALSEMNDEVGRFKGEGTMYLTNNLPYIGTLEYGGYGTGPGATEKTTRDGYSIQAPYGMVRKNVARVKGRIGRIARKLAKEKGLV